MKKQMQEEAQHREQIIAHFGEGLQNQQIIFDGFASHLLASIPCNKI